MHVLWGAPVTPTDGFPVLYQFRTASSAEHLFEITKTLEPAGVILESSA